MFSFTEKNESKSVLFNCKRRKLVKKKILFTDIKDDSISKIIKN